MEQKLISILLASYSNKVRQNARLRGVPANSDAENLILDIALTSVMEQYKELQPFIQKAGL